MNKETKEEEEERKGGEEAIEEDVAGEETEKVVEEEEEEAVTTTTSANKMDTFVFALCQKRIEIIASWSDCKASDVLCTKYSSIFRTN